MAKATRIALDVILGVSKTLKPTLGTAWQYAKTEVVPPMTLNFFHGPNGKKLEDIVSRTTDNFIAGIENRIKEIEAEKLREIQRKEAAAKALKEKLLAEAKRKAEEAKKKAEEEAKKQKAAADKKAQETKAAADAKAKAEAAAKPTAQTKPKAKAKATKKTPDSPKQKPPPADKKKSAPPKK